MAWLDCSFVPPFLRRDQSPIALPPPYYSLSSKSVPKSEKKLKPTWWPNTKITASTFFFIVNTTYLHKGRRLLKFLLIYPKKKKFKAF